jgi:hypothetical protein
VAVTADAESGNAVYWSLDALDLCVELGVPLTPLKAVDMSLVEWFDDENPGRRPLRALAGHPAYARAFQKAAYDLLGDHRYIGYPMARDRPPPGSHLIDRALQPEGVRSAFLTWLTEVSETAHRAPLAALDEILRLALPITSNDGCTRFPEQLRHLARASAVPALARTLRAGLPGELGWIAFDEALQRFDGEIRFDTDWPHLLLHDTSQVVLLGPHGVMAEHQLRVPRLDHLVAVHSPRCTVHNGRIFVSWWDRVRRREVGYWTDEPDRIRTVGRDGPDLGGTMVAGPLARLPQLAPDAATAPPSARPPSDGSVVEKQSWRQIDPAWADSPLGSLDGWVGWQIINGPDGRYLQGIDGRRVDVRPEMTTWTLPAGALRVPADPRPRLVSTHPFGNVVIWEPDGTLPAVWHNREMTSPPFDWWHAMTPRDLTGSARLRDTDDTTAELLLTHAARTNPAHSVETIFPEITSHRLRTAVVAQIDLAARIATDLTKLAALAK